MSRFLLLVLSMSHRPFVFLTRSGAWGSVLRSSIRCSHLIVIVLYYQSTNTGWCYLCTTSALATMSTICVAFEISIIQLFTLVVLVSDRNCSSISDFADLVGFSIVPTMSIDHSNQLFSCLSFKVVRGNTRVWTPISITSDVSIVSCQVIHEWWLVGWWPTSWSLLWCPLLALLYCRLCFLLCFLYNSVENTWLFLSNDWIERGLKLRYHKLNAESVKLCDDLPQIFLQIHPV